MADLKPCPFCGGTAAIRLQRLQGTYPVPVVSCDGCGALVAVGDTPKTTTAAWNRRADAQARKRKSKRKSKTNTEVTENGMG